MAAAAPADPQHNKPLLLTRVSALSPRFSRSLDTLLRTLAEPLGYVWRQEEAGIPTLIRPRTISAERTATLET